MIFIRSSSAKEGSLDYHLSCHTAHQEGGEKDQVEQFPWCQERHDDVNDVERNKCFAHVVSLSG
jgi:hypothetical protein